MAMDFLRKAFRAVNVGPQLAWHSAVGIMVVGAYLAATLTTLVGYAMVQRVLTATAIVFLAVLVWMTAAYVVARTARRMDVVDVAWSGAFVVAAGTSFGLNMHGLRVGWNVQTVVTLLVVAWALRLGYHIARRLLSHKEDKRYVALRKKWRGFVALNMYVRVFFVQAMLATAISLAVIHINLAEPSPLGSWAFIGIVVWILGFGFEAIGDWQLRQHLAKSPKTLMTSGLWRYTQHPNYFGESLQWVGIAIMALGTEFGWVGIISPLIITYLLLFVSGVPLTEKAFKGRRGWSAYKKRTSVFVPWLPRKNS